MDNEPIQNRAALKPLHTVMALTWGAILAERITRAFWPLWSVLFVVLAALLIGVYDALAIEIVWFLFFAALLVIAIFAISGARKMRWPTWQNALSRLDDTMPGRPIRMMLDDQVIGANDAASRAVWDAHKNRIRTRALAAKPVKSDLKISQYDPFGLRYMAVLLLLIGVIFGSVSRMDNIGDRAFNRVNKAAIAPSWEGWLAPPAYTGLPVIYLNDVAPGTLDAPAGSDITLRFYGVEIGGTNGPLVVETVSGIPLTSDPEVDNLSYDFNVLKSGNVSIPGPNGREWQVSIVPDTPPQIEAIGAVEISAQGAFTLPFEARDDYGITNGHARIILDMDALDRRHGLAIAPEPRPEITVELPMPVARGRDDFTEILIEDFNKHPWANLPIKITLFATDASGQAGQGLTHPALLAARHFFDPQAAAIIELRRDLLWNGENALRVAQILRAISHRPAGQFTSETTYLRLRVILRRLETMIGFDLVAHNRDEIADALWDLALQFENGTLADALEQMRRAQERLSEAMKNGASDDEIAQLMDELRKATNDYMQQRAEQQPQGDEGNQSAENSMTLDQNDLQDMMDHIQDLMEQGRMAEAQQALEEFQDMMENMRVTQGEGGQNQSPGEQSMQELSDTLREQQGLSDRAFRDLQEQFDPNASAGQSQSNEGQSGGQGRGQTHDPSGGQAPGQGEGQGQGQAENGAQNQGEGQGNTGERSGETQGGNQSGPSGQSGNDRAQGSAQPGDLGQSLADRQNALRGALENQRRALPGEGTAEGDAARDAIERAERAMNGAEHALRGNDLPGAIDKQADAMDALRDGMRALGDAMASGEQGAPGQQGQSRQLAGEQSNDPLGRSQRGATGVEHNMLQGEDVYRHARDLLDEIRRRTGDATRSDTERNYLHRLLDRF